MSYLANTYKSGDYKAICDRCGCTFKASELKKTWDNLMVCGPDWDFRPEQDYLKPGNPERALPWTRPESPDTFRQDKTFATVNENTIPSGNSGTHGTL